MVFYEAHIKHTEETLTALAHMQYDLFCTGNRIGRTAVAAGLFVFGALNYTQWWGLLLIAYGRYLQQVCRREPHREEARPADKGVRRRVPLLQIYF